ncbi:uncharacterized protein SCHCODRAFT_01184989 [Schizophyllum commune H4-8]|nr:uncharacterized protein SCHCODRAFT_01184989 [Schizophyllum commune H4-8]KAI5893766.1 hypothetical protein SCHCODRAFT_01184989 [Schizophyllum commune H4-8]
MGPNCDPLDPGLLRKIDRTAKADKNIFLTSFLREQRENARTYAAQGQLEMKTWKEDTTPSQRQDTASNLHVHSPAISKPLSLIGFDTPVLKPRNRHKVQDTQRIDISPSRTPAKRAKKTAYVVDHLPSPASQSRSKPLDRRQLSPKAPRRSKAPMKSTSKKRIACDDHSDEDQVARLEERRERKRAKRAIVNPEKAEIVVEPGTSYSEAKERKGKGKAKAKRTKGSEKTPAAFALMHGFVATNVGKNRLTMKTPVPVGVFNKGKASEKTRVKDAPVNIRTKNTFSEGLFLQGTRKKEPTSKKRHRTPSTTSSSSATSSSRSRVRRHPENEFVHEKETLPSPMKDEAGRCVSEVWDIESEASEESKIRTLILDTGLRGWNVLASPQTPPAGGRSKGSPTSPPFADDFHVRSSPSLRPSQSASQCAWKGLALRPEAARSAVSHSKYFKQVNAVADDAPPTVDDVVGEAADTPAAWHYTEMPPPPRPVPAEHNSRHRALWGREPTPPAGAASSEDPSLTHPLPGALSNELKESHESVLDDGSFVTHNYFSECLAFSDGCMDDLPVHTNNLSGDFLLAAEAKSGVLNGDALALGWDIGYVALCADDAEATAGEVDGLEDVEHPVEDFIGDGFDSFLDMNDLDLADDLGEYPCDKGLDQVVSFVAGAFDDYTGVPPHHDLVHFEDGYFAAERYESSTCDEEGCTVDLRTRCDGYYSDVDYTERGDDWVAAGEWSDDSGGSLWIGQDPEVASELNEDDLSSSLATHLDVLHAFAEGKALLMGVPNTSEVLSVAHGRVSQAEADVARSLHDHWTPYRPL